MFRLIRKFAKLIIKANKFEVLRDYDLEYLLWILNIYLKIKSLPGHIAEVGVADGRNTVLFGRLIKLHNDQSTRQYIGFDTFDGYTKENLKRDNHLSKTEWKNNSRDAVLKRCQDNDVEDIIELFEGDATEIVPKILKDHKGKKFQAGKAKFALLYIDCNTYFPAINSMESFLPHIVPGGFIVIDEKRQGSESEAILDFAKKHSFNVKRLGSNHTPMCIEIPTS